jgi:hypothetical protein
MEVKQETSLSTAIVSGDEEGKRDPVKLSVVSKQYDVESESLSLIFLFECCTLCDLS